MPLSWVNKMLANQISADLVVCDLPKMSQLLQIHVTLTETIRYAAAKPDFTHSLAKYQDI